MMPAKTNKEKEMKLPVRQNIFIFYFFFCVFSIYDMCAKNHTLQIAHSKKKKKNQNKQVWRISTQLTLNTTLAIIWAFIYFLLYAQPKHNSSKTKNCNKLSLKYLFVGFTYHKKEIQQPLSCQKKMAAVVVTFVLCVFWLFLLAIFCFSLLQPTKVYLKSKS